MRKEKRISDEVEKTLNAVNELPRLEGNPFLYTRIKTVIEKYPSPVKKKSIFVFKPVIIGLIIIINVITTIYFLQADIGSYPPDESLIESLNNDYKINQSYYEYISLN